eukprot:scaffold7000_cov132-Cylindrotheca_fusiformis.AAC.2
MAVVHNQNLFQALVSCLSSSGDDTATAISAKSNLQSLPSRKRASSVGGETPSDTSNPSKLMKLSHGPNAFKRTNRVAAANSSQNGNQTSTKPEMNIRVLAATILFVSFEHLDHWPAALVRAYADDCFGPRLWVDLPAAQLLAKNLELTHQEGASTSPSHKNDELIANAQLVADYYKQFSRNGLKGDQGGRISPLLPSPLKQLRRGSHSSLASQTSSLSGPNSSLPRRPRSTSFESIDKTKGEPEVAGQPSTTAAAKSNGEESDSGDEEVAISTAVSKEPPSAQGGDGDSSSSGEEDGEEVVLATTRSFDDDAMQTEPRHSPSVSSTSSMAPDPNALKLTYPVSQQHLVFTRIRQRYFGVNLEHAHGAIAQSLHDRLDVKSKQNSGLLQTLPLFTSIPSVRRLVTSSLERWLQSPALAGLARNLFSTTVNMMTNVDPPLPDDLEAIDNILAMRLKANQVSYR